MTNARHDDNDELGEQIGGRPSRIGIADTGIATDNGARRQISRKGDSFGYRVGSRVVNYVNVRRLEIWVSELKFPLNCQSDKGGQSGWADLTVAACSGHFIHVWNLHVPKIFHRSTSGTSTNQTVAKPFFVPLLLFQQIRDVSNTSSAKNLIESM